MEREVHRETQDYRGQGGAHQVPASVCRWAPADRPGTLDAGAGARGMGRVPQEHQTAHDPAAGADVDSPPQSNPGRQTTPGVHHGTGHPALPSGAARDGRPQDRQQRTVGAHRGTEAGEALETPGGGLQASGYPEAGPGQSTRSRRGTATDRHRKGRALRGTWPFPLRCWRTAPAAGHGRSNR